VRKPLAHRYSSMSYERGCQGQTPPSQERGLFFLHSEIAKLAIATQSFLPNRLLGFARCPYVWSELRKRWQRSKIPSRH
jgi:hypothetical protein